MTLNVIFLKKDFVLEDGRVIPKGTSGFLISKEYLGSKSLSPEDEEKILSDGKLAKSQGNLYVEFKGFKKYLSVDPDYINWSVS